jgi:hypothetical protein
MIKWDLLWEAVKLPLRLLVFAAVGFFVDFAIEWFTVSKLDVAPMVIILLTTLDKYIHEVNASQTKKPLEGFDRGLLPF